MEKLLIVGPAWVGDMVMTQTLFRYLKTTRPGCQIEVLAPAWSQPLLARMPEVARAIELPFGHGDIQLKKRRQLGRNLRVHHYHEAIIIPRSLKAALIPFFAKIPVRVGFLGEWRYGLINQLKSLDKTTMPLMVQRFCALAQPNNTKPLTAQQIQAVAPRLHADATAVNHALQRYRLSPTKKILALCPGAEYGPAKRWPTHHFAAIAKEYIAKQWQVLLLGSSKELPLAVEIQQACQSGCINLTGKTNLNDAVDLIAAANAVVSNDSGLMHIAAALDKPLVALYGSSDPRYTPPLSDKAKIIQLDLNCNPCFKRTCPLGHTHCLTQLKPEQVSRKLATITA